MCNRGWAYIVKAATIILLCNTLVQIMQTFNWSFAVAETADSSILASLARPSAYIIYPIVGVLSWQLAAAAVTGFIAKENVVGTLAVCFVGLENLINTDDLELVQGAGTEAAGIIAITKVAALAYLMFNLYTPPCFAALGAMNSEMKSKKWFWAGIGYLLGVGYTVGYCVYTVGTLITAPSSLNVGAALGGLAIVVVSLLLSHSLSQIQTSTSSLSMLLMLKGIKMIANIILIAVLIVILGSASLYIYKAKKRGEHCIGCPYAKQCPSKGHCSESHSGKSSG